MRSRKQLCRTYLYAPWEKKVSQEDHLWDFSTLLDEFKTRKNIILYLALYFFILYRSITLKGGHKEFLS